jgi:probable rRNA maturation factor
VSGPPFLTVQRACAGRTPTNGAFRTWVEAALRGAQALPGALVLRIVDEAEGAELNQAWRKRGAATNVLSFPADLLENPAFRVLGDLVLCAPVVRREARAQGKRQAAHWAHLVIHGTLHLLGYDHVVKTEAEAMEALECSVLAGLGFPDPYQTD